MQYYLARDLIWQICYYLDISTLMRLLVENRSDPFSLKNYIPQYTKWWHMKNIVWSLHRDPTSRLAGLPQDLIRFIISPYLANYNRLTIGEYSQQSIQVYWELRRSPGSYFSLLVEDIRSYVLEPFLREGGEK